MGIAEYSELAKSMMFGDEIGVLEIAYNPRTRKLLDVDALGQREDGAVDAKAESECEERD